MRLEYLIPVSFEIVCEHADIETGRIEIRERFWIAFFPMRDQVIVERACPPDTAFEKREFQRRKAPRHPVQEKRFAYRLAGGGEVPDVLVDVIRIRAVGTEALRAGVEGRHDFELQA